MPAWYRPDYPQRCEKRSRDVLPQPLSSRNRTGDAFELRASRVLWLDASSSKTLAKKLSAAQPPPLHVETRVNTKPRNLLLRRRRRRRPVLGVLRQREGQERVLGLAHAPAHGRDGVGPRRRVHQW